ncbi:GGDEF domain-containing protein [Deltaproteobacteria bacterium]|nr:GGDEF domain-containing protein [Deltaproteobacteria bacterium]
MPFPPGPKPPADDAEELVTHPEEPVVRRVPAKTSDVATLADNDGEITRRMRIVPRSAKTRVEVPTLRVVAGRDMLSYVTLNGSESVILGRDEGAGMILTDALVSRRHARVTVNDDQTIAIQDLGSTNGTSVNGKPIDRAFLLPGDHLEVGGVSLRLDMLSLEEIEHIENVVARLKQQNLDPLTGLLTRAWLDEELPPLLDKCQRSGWPLSCIFFDIDHFKQVNDRFGHHIGDDVLVGCSRLMLYGVRDNDACVRYGGEEIVMFLANADHNAAVEVGERVRREVQGHDWSRTAPGLKVTVSAGVAQWRAREPARKWMARADVALFAAKRAGRNQVSVDPT